MPPKPPIEAVIPAAPKDYSKLPCVTVAISRYVKDVSRIHIIAPTAPPDYLENYLNGVCVGMTVDWHLDEEVLLWDRFQCKYRPNWVFQQMLKLFQNVTDSDWFLVTDADIVVNRPIKLWASNGRPILYWGREQFWPPYFKFNETILGYGKVYEHSFLSEFTLYSKKLVADMLASVNLTPDTFWHKLTKVVSADCYPAESELYGSYVWKQRPDVYEIRHLKTALSGKYGNHIWTLEEIEADLAMYRRQDNFHLISLHSWE